MKKYGILNSYFVKFLVDFGYIDKIVIVDVGLFVFDGVLKIDFLLKLGFLVF